MDSKGVRRGGVFGFRTTNLRCWEYQLDFGYMLEALSERLSQCTSLLDFLSMRACPDSPLHPSQYPYPASDLGP